MTKENLAEKYAMEQKIFAGSNGLDLPYCRKVVGKPDANGKYPVVLLLHGAGERGTDNSIQLVHGTAGILAYAEERMEGLIFLAPQCPEGMMWIDQMWNLAEHRMSQAPRQTLETALELLEAEVAANGDRNRIYVTGISMGGFGTWDAISRKPEYFAAAMPVCGGGDVLQAEKLVDLPIFIHHGAVDSVVMPSRSKDMAEAISAAGGKKAELTLYDGVDHNSWVPAYKSMENLEKFFSCKK